MRARAAVVGPIATTAPGGSGTAAAKPSTAEGDANTTTARGARDRTVATSPSASATVRYATTSFTRAPRSRRIAGRSASARSLRASSTMPPGTSSDRASDAPSGCGASSASTPLCARRSFVARPMAVTGARISRASTAARIASAPRTLVMTRRSSGPRAVTVFASASRSNARTWTHGRVTTRYARRSSSRARSSSSRVSTTHAPSRHTGAPRQPQRRSTRQRKRRRTDLTRATHLGAIKRESGVETDRPIARDRVSAKRQLAGAAELAQQCPLGVGREAQREIVDRVDPRERRRVAGAALQRKRRLTWRRKHLLERKDLVDPDIDAKPYETRQCEDDRLVLARADLGKTRIDIASDVVADEVRA